ncbi:hypothetical protein DVA67_003675 [Solirubrobacter sp. CPCC 204708]|uniref:Uncharacterized protein n=1 Tax=Solirubrobacter deserti TaxID=2282478 RepID=A0ABT4RTK5_9ACTN|nr:hypothetical protein [Solirubrobacter deserti]MBE2315060.1 hypothetical protein [Solirubrobacter deserti]MDA0141907.1 hypothetical protein [Solirubrobacter deserti]
MTRWIALLVLAAVGATMLLTWPEVDDETGPEKAHSLYGFTCPPHCDLGPAYVAFRVNKLFAARTDPGQWADKRLARKPSIGAIASWGDGRVAFVEQVLSPDAVEVTELTPERLTRRTVTRGHGWPRGFILIGPPTSDKPAPTGEGTLI